MLTMVQSIADAQRVALEADESVLLLGEDIGKNGGVFRATEGLWKQFGSERVIDTPLSEAGIVGSALGLAMGGFKPIVEIQFLSFITPAFEQIVSHVARMRLRSQGTFSNSMVIRAPYGGGIGAPELHSDSTEAYFVHTPGLRVVVPSSPFTAKGLLLGAVECPDPVLFLEPLRLYRTQKEEVPADHYILPIDRAKVIKQGEDVTLIGWGAMISLLKEADQLLLEQDISAEIIDVQSLSPIDEVTIFESVKKTGRAVIVHEAPRTCGVGAEIAARLSEEVIDSLEAPIKRVAGYDVPYPLFALEHAYLPSTDKIVRAVMELVYFQ
ncbi:alpha-ketoacid dehydrogenase subunit beta [Shimazuella sp. AN120528]|uniref:alpha-ketoacid dehydrogenase subunit beta n=1 Tax=Shimazuella soli TaxID=1892854 RepID=UPI001F0F05B6|nr:alpha-ketoacid dehydrogenase subunit beta [Shimazuella soli]MCH5583433.1 alpha-ketoacid dehydrogenase subunit beta [Shimazuella soli]